jgi:DNA-binding phage protein
MSRLIDELRKAIERDERAPGEIAREAGIARSQLSRLLSGERGLNFDTAERLARVLNLEIIIRPKRRGKESR